MEFAKVLRIKTSTIVFNVYIDENLTRMRHQLFANVWKHKKSEQWHSAWTKDGKIFVKLSLGDLSVRINSQED